MIDKNRVIIGSDNKQDFGHKIIRALSFSKALPEDEIAKIEDSFGKATYPKTIEEMFEFLRGIGLNPEEDLLYYRDADTGVNYSKGGRS